MSPLRKWIVFIMGSIALMGLGLFVAVYLVFSGRPSKIVDFHPTKLPAYADAPFFFSIADDLMFSDHVDAHAPTLLHGPIGNFLVSPDSQKIAVVTGGNLVIVDRSGPSQRTVVPVSNVMRAKFSGDDKSKLIGQHYFRDTSFEWSRNAKSLYLIGDTYKSNGQAFSSNGELWRYDLDTSGLQLVLKPFPAEKYFLGLNGGVYFWVPAASKDLQLEYFDGKATSGIAEPGATHITINQLSTHFAEQPFASFDEIDYIMHILPALGVLLTFSDDHRVEKLEINARPYLRFMMGSGLEVYFCGDLRNSAFLPGDRYLLFNANGCGNYDGMLLIDSVTGQYQRLPAKTRAYITLNTISYPRYEISRLGGLVPK
jgi:hypothetical protein